MLFSQFCATQNLINPMAINSLNYPILFQQAITRNMLYTCTRKVAFVCMLLLVSLSGMAAEIVITGMYNGKNIYVHNPMNGSSGCISSIQINGKILSAPQSSAIDIDLSHFKIKDKVEIKIIHGDNCRPKVINPTALAEKADFQFGFSEVTAATIEWVGRGETKDSRYFIEVFRNNTWHTITSKQCIAQAGNNKYSIQVNHAESICKYRIKYYNMATGESQYSRLMEFVPTARKAVKKVVASNKIELSTETDYELLDGEYNVVLKGKGNIIDINNLKKGEYHLVFDNQIEILAKN
jgi:hypothetical protein